MEIDITDFFKTMDAPQLSGSRLELGQNAGQITWNNSLAASKDKPLLDDEDKLEAFRVWLKPWGGWDDAEIAAMTPHELNALFVQWIAGDVREAGLDTKDPDWAEYEAGCEAGQYSSSLFGNDGKVYFTLSH